MKRYGQLFDLICTFTNLLAAARAAMEGKLHKPHIARFFLNLEPQLLTLRRELLQGTYQPGPYRCFEIFEPKRRFICAAPIRDRVVHHAICNLLTPVLDRSFIYDSYACRVGKGTHAAIRRAQSFSRKRRFFLKSDIAGFFASIDHAVLKSLLRRKIKDHRLLELMDNIIGHPVPGYPPGKGLAIGNLTSQWWANLYLDALDHCIKDELAVKCYIRYMDDMLLFSDSKPELHRLRSRIERFLTDRLKLSLKHGATYIAPVMQGIPFLGMRIFPGTIRLNHRSRIRFRRKLRQIEVAYSTGEMNEDAFLRSAASLLGHVQQADTYRMRKKMFFDFG